MFAKYKLALQNALLLSIHYIYFSYLPYKVVIFEGSYKRRGRFSAERKMT